MLTNYLICIRQVEALRFAVRIRGASVVNWIIARCLRRGVAFLRESGSYCIDNLDTQLSEA